MDPLLLILILGLLVLLQLSQLRAYRHRLALISDKISHTSRSNQEFAILQNFPHPLGVLNSNNAFLFSTPGLDHLMRKHGRNSSYSTLRDVEQTLGIDIASHLHQREGVVQITCTISPQHQEEFPARYIVISWPITIPTLVHGRVLVFYEQTLSLNRQREYTHLEKQLLHCLREMSKELTNLTERAEKITPETRIQRLQAISQTAERMEELTSYLETHHQQLRSLMPQRTLDLKQILQSVSHNLRPSLHEQGIHMTLNLPSHLWVRGNREDFELAYTTVIDAFIQRSKRGDELNVTAVRENDRIKICFDAPHLSLGKGKSTVTETELTQLYEKSDLHHFKLQITLARQFFAKYHGSLRLSSNELLGTRCQIILMEATSTATKSEPSSEATL